MRLRWLCGLLLAGIMACGEPAGGSEPSDFTQGSSRNPAATPAGTLPPSGTGGAGAPGAGGSFAGASSAGGSAGAAPVGSGSGGDIPPTGTAGGGTLGGSGPSTGGAQGDGVPCDVAAILKQKCQTCHGNPLMSGPMPLITWNDLQASSTAVPSAKVADRVKARINDTARPMPPATRPQLTAAEKQTLLTYLDAGAQRSTASCPGAGPDVTGATGGTAGDGYQGYRPADSECDYIQELRAHAGQTPGDTSPFSAPTGGDHYEMFYFRPKWTEKVQIIRIDPITDNGAVLHHWLLYMEDGVGSGDGTHQQDLGLQSPASQLLSGWAPGNEGLPLTREIGLQVIQGPNARFGIEIHYNTNANPANRRDRSGARLCASKKLRPKEATVHWLGTQAIIGIGLPSEAYGTCTVQQESHIIAHSPHMHTMGRYMKTIVTKRGGGTVTITDQPFAFEDQQIFPIKNASGEIVVQPGDVIDTTCSYEAGIFTFGPNTDQEMCYNFILAWPPGSLSNGLPGIVGGQNTCMDTIL